MQWREHWNRRVDVCILIFLLRAFNNYSAGMSLEIMQVHILMLWTLNFFKGLQQLIDLSKVSGQSGKAGTLTPTFSFPDLRHPVALLTRCSSSWNFLSGEMRTLKLSGGFLKGQLETGIRGCTIVKAWGLIGVWHRIYFLNILWKDKNWKTTVTEDMLLSSINVKSSCMHSNLNRISLS